MGSAGLILPQLFNGLSVASLYLLAAVGLALSFGLMRVINMAHGEMLMLGGYMAWMTQSVVPGGWGILLALPVAFAGTAFLGGIIHTVLIRRLADRPLDTLLATWGLSLILQQMARDVFGPIGVEVRAPAWLNGSIAWGGMAFPSARLFIIIMTIVTLASIAWLITRSRVGLDIRAVNQDRMMASATGINVGAVERIVFCAGAGVAGLAGVLLALLGPVTPNAGQVYVIPAFMVVVMGGLGSLTGTSVAALILGLFSALAQIFFDVSVAQMLMLVLVILFLQVRPQGVVAVRSRALDV